MMNIYSNRSTIRFCLFLILAWYTIWQPDTSFCSGTNRLLNAGESDERVLQYKNFIEQIYVRNRKVYWSGLELGSGHDHVEKVLGRPLQLEQNIGDELFFVKTYYRKMHVKLWFEFAKTDASLLGITIGFDGFMLSKLEIKKLEDCLKRRIPNVKKHFFVENEESYAWKVKGIDSIKIIIKGDFLAIGNDRYFDFWD